MDVTLHLLDERKQSGVCLRVVHQILAERRFGEVVEHAPGFVIDQEVVIRPKRVQDRRQHAHLEPFRIW